MIGLPTKFIEVNRHTFKLTVWRKITLRRRYERERVYPIAVGAAGYETPEGPHYIVDKARHPQWRPPDSKWVPEELVGTLIPGDDPRNPIKEAFIAITPDWSIGMHGTDDVDSLGTQASHGCIRMTREDVRDLYTKVGKNTLVFIY